MSETSFFYRWLWLCLLLAIALTSVVLWRWGLTPWSAVLIALSFVCPAIIVWGAWTVRRNLQSRFTNYKSVSAAQAWRQQGRPKVKATHPPTTTNQGSKP